MTHHTQPPPAYLRQPALHGDTIVFVSDDDLWRVPTSGGVATRLTAGLSEPSTPALSADGRWLAYTGRDEQHPEAWVMPAVGGPARRLTWLGSEGAVRGFLPDGRVLFCSNHGQPFFRNWHAFAVPLQGGEPERLPLGQVNHLAFGPGGAQLIGRNTADPARWKRYAGGTAGQLWVDAQGSGRFTRLALPGNPTSPMWLSQRLWFLGDHEGVGNLYSCRPDGSELQRHTAHHDFYARHASTDGRRIVYQCGAALWLFDPDQGQARPLDITLPSAHTQAARRFVPAAEHLQGLALHPQGHSLAAEVRGQVFCMALWEGGVQRLGAPPSQPQRLRLARWLADGRSRVAVGDASGEERVTVFDEHGSERELPWDVGHVTALSVSPVGSRLALANHRNELWIGDLADDSCRLADRSEHGRIDDPAWSPCGGWLAYSFATDMRHTAIKLVDAASGRSLLATQPEFRDYAPAFDPSGRWLLFLSVRTFDPVYDAVQFEMSFPRAARPYLLALQADAAPPFDPAPRGMKPERGADEPPSTSTTSATEAQKALPALDPEGLVRRIAAFPVPEGRYGRIAGAADGKVLWTSLPIQGAHGRGGHQSGSGQLQVFDLKSGEQHTLAEGVDQFELAADGHTLLLRQGQRLRVLDATKPPEEGPGAAPADNKPSRRSGVLDLARLRVAVDPRAEWAQMLREVWRLQRNQFWRADMAGIAWERMYERYAALLPRVATRGELSDLIWELQGELGTSHAYESGGDHRKPPAVPLGRLAADLHWDGEGWRIDRTVQGDTWDAAADSPLNAVGVNLRGGDRIVAVAGQACDAHTPPQALLVHQAGTKVALTLLDSAGARREVLVTTLSDETAARYREWVERNRAWVHQASDGRAGYLHLPDMMSAGFAEFHRYFATECDRDALIVDARYNRGGHVSELLLEKVARRRIAWGVTRWSQPSPYPGDSPAGAVVALTNEHAGSDGDIFSHNFKLMKIGPLVGQRTWGGVIGIWPRHKLMDGSETTQPEYAFWFKDVGFKVENYGTDPDVVVDNAPQDDAFNAPERDRQLATALNEALAAVERDGVYRPDFGAPG